MQNAYAVLGVPRTATVSEIKRAFRKKAKLLHPDASPSHEAEFRLLVQAYEILTDARQRSIFDGASSARGWTRRERKTSSFDYREWLLGRADDESRAKLIFFDLMHRREDDAVAEFKRMNMTRSGFSLCDWFAREDFMDYGFILAEELVLRREYYDAALLLEQIIRMERGFPYFRLFFPEVLGLALDVLQNKIEGAVSDELALDAWERALELGLGRKTDTELLTRMASAYARIGDHMTARMCMQAAGAV